jgi:hypothetical protein
MWEQKAGRQRFAAKSPAERLVSQKYFGHLKAGANKFFSPHGYEAYLRKQAGHLSPVRTQSAE